MLYLTLVFLLLGASPGTAQVVPKLPFAFEANTGQTAKEVKFLARGSGYTLFLTPTEAVLSLRESVLRMKLVRSNPAARVAGLDPLPVESKPG